ncbi:PA14 domain-containing protein [Coleofasciculus sp. F4-SAH-05]|uniref:PA14 domain-containing protein n=1 Tax=Coleofasciculus sp. F4-SAH-05 TaxID=3069525 RepID=UPI003302CFD4
MQLDTNLSEMTHTSMMSMENNEPLPHQDHPVKQTEHLGLFDLVPHSAATHVAVNDGSWFDPNTWEQGQVPGTDARVVISEGVHVTYDAESDTRLETVRVDGTLEFAHNRNTKIVVDTFIASPTSTLTIGSEANPIQANKTARIVIADNGEIDSNWDSTLISRGVVTHGKVRIHGAEKLDFISLQTDASAGDNELVLNLPDGMTTPAGWQVGDKLVLGGTSYNPDGSDEDNSRFQDEVLTITEINGNRIQFTNNDITSGDNTVLRFDHHRPQGFESENLKLYIANTSRNVIFETENAETLPTQQRGHVMFMHNPDVEIQNAGFYNLGRTNIFSGVDQVSRVREADTVAVKNLSPELQPVLSQASYDNDDPNSLDVTNVPLRRLSGFESYNSDLGIVFWNHMRNNDGQLGFNGPGTKEAHDARSLVDNFKLWNIYGEGIFLQYSSQIDFVDGLIVGDPENPVPLQKGMNGNGRGHGIGSNTLSQNLLYKNLRIEGFERGVRLPNEGNRSKLVPFLGSRLEDSYLANNTYNLSKKEHPGDRLFFPDSFDIVNTEFNISGANIAPTATFSYESIGSQGVVTFDAGDSFDSDPPEALELEGNAIASYGWDFDNDGTIDEFGRQVNHQFDSTGSHNVSLTVWDSQGATSTLTKQVQVTPTPYPNLIADGTFSTTSELGRAINATFDSTRTSEGWIGNNWSLDSTIGNGGAAVVSGSWNAGIGQIFLDNGSRRGKQTLSIDIKNTEDTNKANEITVSVWGVDGEFRSTAGNLDGPQQAGAIPMTKEKLLHQTVGGSTFDWTSFNWDVDFGEGYEFVTVQVVAKGVHPDNGDFIAIDNISIGDPAINGNGNGLKAEYYNNRDFTDLALTRTDETVDFNWGSGSPDAAIDANTYSVRWTGSVAPLHSETYEFFTNSDDGVRLWVDDQLLIDNWTNHGATENSGTIDLQAGQQYDIRMDYYENFGKSVAQLLWSSESQSKEIIPESQLYSPAVDTPSPEVSGNGTGLTAEYYNNRDFTDLALTRTDDTVDFNWGSGSPDAAIDPNTYSVRWTGFVEPLHSETYQFKTSSDDGVRLWVNDQLLVDNWTDHGVTDNRGTIDLEAGQQYDIRMEYYENRGKSVAQLAWSSPSQSEEIIPKSQLYAANSSDFSVNEMMQNRASSLTTVVSGGDELLGNTGVNHFDNGGHSHLLITEENGSQDSFDFASGQMTLANHQDVSDSVTASEVTPINLMNSIGIGDPFTNETVESLIEMPQAELLTVPTLF